ncbi:MAG: hypothetical protein IRZ21_01475 [Thermoleophilaceae bacterium]|nr:hypothetical protein [Thermoleophilaceae bacterium]
MADDVKRVDVGFSGGQVLALRMLEETYRGLREALERGDGGWHELRTEDSEVAIYLGEVVYVRLDTERHSVGFSGRG